MKKALIFSFSFQGHRQIYAQYFVELLLTQGYQIYLVIDSSEADKYYPYLETYRSNSSVKFSSIQDLKLISLRNFRKLQDDLEINLSVFLEADDQLNLLSRQILPGYPRLRGKNIGIFIRSINYIHQPRSIFNFKSILELSNWNIYQSMRHLFVFLCCNPLYFHEFFLSRFKLLDVALTPDEAFVNSHTQMKQYHWFPDIIFPLLAEDPDLEKAEVEKWKPLLKNFIDANYGKEVFLYFGLATQYKGYDILLRLALEEKACFIHCGLFDSEAKYVENVNEIRSALASSGSLFETNSYIKYYSTIRLFFESCKYVILPYRNHLGSSGIMLQAIHFGKPVLVPDCGLMAARTRQFLLGQTYQHDDFQDLRAKMHVLKDGKQDFSPHLAEYQALFSKENVQRDLNSILSEK